MREVECRVCGELVGRGPAGLGIKQHSGRHRREFRELTGREPEDYDEVIRFFNRNREPTLAEAALPDEQRAITTF